jgi:protein SCO1/2
MTRAAAVLACALALAASASPSARAQRMEPLPQELEGIGIVEHLNERVPLDLAFTDEDGRAVRLGDYFHEGRPVLLSVVYYSCPMLCTLVLNGMTDAMKELDWTPGHEYELVTVSFDSRETHSLARLKKESYLSEYGRPGAGAGWHFLVGSPESVRALTEAVGFNYRWDEKGQQFAHQAALYVLTPEGTISRYLYGVMFEPRTLRLSLVEAGAGKVGSAFDQIVLYCFHYDETSGSYALAARNVMRAGGILTVIVLGSVLSRLWIRDRRRRHGLVAGHLTP